MGSTLWISSAVGSKILVCEREPIECCSEILAPAGELLRCCGVGRVAIRKRGHLKVMGERITMEAFDLLIGPGHLAKRERHKVIKRRANRASIRSAIVPEINPNLRAQLSELHKAIEIPLAVAECLRSREFERLSSVGFDLSRDSLRLCEPDGCDSQIAITQEERVIGKLQVVPGTMIVFRRGLILAFATRAHPVDELAKPFLHALLVGRCPRR